MRFAICLLLFAVVTGNAQTSTGKKEVLGVVQKFFDALEKQDSIAFRNMFLEDAPMFAARVVSDSVMVRRRLPSGFRFRPDQIIKERMREASTTVEISGRIAMVWAPYDLWINDTFSHCGVDVFTLIKTSVGWKFASVSYTMENEGCN